MIRNLKCVENMALDIFSILDFNNMAAKVQLVGHADQLEGMFTGIDLTFNLVRFETSNKRYVFPLSSIQLIELPNTNKGASCID